MGCNCSGRRPTYAGPLHTCGGSGAVPGFCLGCDVAAGRVQLRGYTGPAEEAAGVTTAGAAQSIGISGAVKAGVAVWGLTKIFDAILNSRRR